MAKTFEEELKEAGLNPDVWQPVDRAPIVPSNPASNQQQGPGQFFSGPLSSSLQHDSDFTKTKYGGAGTPEFPLMPSSPANAAVNAATTSATKAISNQAGEAAILADTANQNALKALAASFQGDWNSLVTYALGATVIYLGVLYTSLITNNLGNIPSSSPADWQSQGSVSFVGPWSALVTYTEGQSVSTATPTQLWVAVQGSLNENPTTTTGF
jgi:hypothetical protein